MNRNTRWKKQKDTSNPLKSRMYEFETRTKTKYYLNHTYMVSILVKTRVRARNRPIHILYLGYNLGRYLGCPRFLATQWEQVAVQAICPPPTGGFHLFDGERDPVVPMDSTVTASAAALVPRQVPGGPARNTRSTVRRARVFSDAQVVSEAHVEVTPLANDNIDEGVNPSWNGINDDDLGEVDTPIESDHPENPEDDDWKWIGAAKREQRTRYLAAQARRAKYPARDANNLFEPRRGLGFRV